MAHCFFNAQAPTAMPNTQRPLIGHFKTIRTAQQPIQPRHLAHNNGVANLIISNLQPGDKFCLSIYVPLCNCFSKLQTSDIFLIIFSEKSVLRKLISNCKSHIITTLHIAKYSCIQHSFLFLSFLNISANTNKLHRLSSHDMHTILIAKRYFDIFLNSYARCIIVLSQTSHNCQNFTTFNTNNSSYHTLAISNQR